MVNVYEEPKYCPRRGWTIRWNNAMKKYKNEHGTLEGFSFPEPEPSEVDTSHATKEGKWENWLLFTLIKRLFTNPFANPLGYLFSVLISVLIFLIFCLWLFVIISAIVFLVHCGVVIIQEIFRFFSSLISLFY